MLACMNSMDHGAFVFTQTFWLDLFLWTTGALLLNGVVLTQVRGGNVPGEPAPSWFRRSFFLLVAACLVLLLAVVSAGAPLLGIHPEVLAQCTLDVDLLALLVVGPALLFSGQAVLFQGLRQPVFGQRRGLSLVVLSLASVLLVVVASEVRASALPQLCGSPRGGY